MYMMRRFKKLCSQHQHRVYTFAYYYLGNREDAEDVIQEVWPVPVGGPAGIGGLIVVEVASDLQPARGSGLDRGGVGLALADV